MVSEFNSQLMPVAWIRLKIRVDKLIETCIQTRPTEISVTVKVHIGTSVDKTFST